MTYFLYRSIGYTLLPKTNFLFRHSYKISHLFIDMSYMPIVGAFLTENPLIKREMDLQSKIKDGVFDSYPPFCYRKYWNICSGISHPTG